MKIASIRVMFEYKSNNDMNIYILEAEAEASQCVVPVNDEDWDLFSKFDGRPLRESWSPIEIEYDFEDFGDRPVTDFPSFATHVPVFSERAIQQLSYILEANGEILPLNCNGENYYAYNVTCIIDALDLQHSEVVRFSSGRIMDITKYAFYNEKLLSISIFKIPQAPLSYVFVTDQFVELIKRSELTGFVFRPI